MLKYTYNVNGTTVERISNIYFVELTKDITLPYGWNVPTQELHYLGDGEGRNTEEDDLWMDIAQWQELLTKFIKNGHKYEGCSEVSLKGFRPWEDPEWVAQRKELLG